MKIEELLTELTFKGSQCTKDCSGHEAGFNHQVRKGTSSDSYSPYSPSFNKGAAIARADRNVTKAPQPRDKGRFAARPKPRTKKSK